MHAAPALTVGLVAGVAIGYGLLGAAVPGDPRLALSMADSGQGGGHSVHEKNRDTPEWMLELQTQQAQQAPVVMERGMLSIWI